ncbi:Cyclic nucleotide-gated ion channel 1 [Melia azedarach]|uniref:Cyclic nucleotide-gated ion channel 1 n=1 Tax=Melia azedarach TaxID=155640 RepID=A0ACC1X3T6_MELAZ|nr:Cyclic nucleotide-gated ion channel 1 [Melia azedarach]
MARNQRCWCRKFAQQSSQKPQQGNKLIKSELCLEMLKKVPIFQRMEEQLLNAICDCLKPMLYAEGCYIVKEGEPIGELLFIMQGTLSATTIANSGNTRFV